MGEFLSLCYPYELNAVWRSMFVAPGRRVAPCMSRVSAQARHIEPAFPQDVCSREGDGLTRAEGAGGVTTCASCRL